MKFIADVGEILVLFFSDGNACIHIFYALRLKRIFKRGIQQRTYPIAATARRNVYGSFDRPVIRRPVFKLRGIGISHNFAADLSYKIRVKAHNIFHTFGELTFIRGVIFKRYCRAAHIKFIYSTQCRRVFRYGVAYNYLIHVNSPFLRAPVASGGAQIIWLNIKRRLNTSGVFVLYDFFDISGRTVSAEEITRTEIVTAQHGIEHFLPVVIVYRVV